MKNLYLMAFAALMAMPAVTTRAQQLPNNDFEEAWSACTPWISDTSKPTMTQGENPASWCISHVRGMYMSFFKSWMGATTVGEQATGYNNTKGVKLVNTPNPYMSSQIVPAYMTLGTTWSTSELIKEKDGGSFGGIDFTKRPDALSFMAKREQNPDSLQPFTVVAYAWKGTTTQTQVPGCIVMSGTPAQVDMVNRDRNILDIATAKGGAVTKSDDFELIAKINDNTHTEAFANWTEITIPFQYSSNAIPEKFNVVFAANNYFSDKHIIKDDALYVDDVKLVYWSQLNSLKIKGVDVEGFNPDTYTYEIDDVMPALADVTYTLKGQAAQAQMQADAASNTITIGVANMDDAFNGEQPTNYHLYTLKFKSADTPAAEAKLYSGKLDVTMMGSTLAAAQVATISITPIDETTCSFALPNFSLGDMALGDIEIPVMNMTKTADGTSYTGSVESMKLLGGGIEAKVDVTGDIKDNGDINLVIDVKWLQGDTQIPIDVRFYAGSVIPEYWNQYDGKLDINMAGNDLAVGTPASIYICNQGNGVCTFMLPNFTLEGLGNLGDIIIPGVSMTQEGEKTSYAGSVDALSLAGGEIVASVELNGVIKGQDILFNIPVTWNGIPIAVKFYAGNDPTTGIENVATMQGEVQYYDLMGRRVENAQNGIFILKQGDRTLKVRK